MLNQSSIRVEVSLAITILEHHMYANLQLRYLNAGQDES